MLSNLLNQLNMTSGNVYNHIECVVAKYYKHSERSSAEVKGGWGGYICLKVITVVSIYQISYELKNTKHVVACYCSHYKSIFVFKYVCTIPTSASVFKFKL